MRGKKRKKPSATPNYHNHGHNYNTRFKRHCCFCSSNQGSTGVEEHSIQNVQVPVACDSRQNAFSLVACNKEAKSMHVQVPVACDSRLGSQRQNASFLFACNSVSNNKAKPTPSLNKTKYSAWHRTLVACANSAFPNDVILNILLLMPAKLLYEVFRFVCLGWRNLIAAPSFTSTHLLMSSAATNGVLYEDRAYPHLAFHTETQTNSNGDYEIVHTSFGKPPFWCKIVSSYRGLVLLHDLSNIQLFHVANLVTRTKISLPPLPGLRIRDTRTCCIALSYASSDDRYKVVLVGYAKPFDKKGDVLERPKVFAYTVGVDQSWRIVDVQGIPVCKTVRNVFSHRPFTIRGIIYWINFITMGLPWMLTLKCSTNFLYSLGRILL